VATAGQNTTYKKEHNKIAEKMCELGATDIDLADAFQVDVRTIHRWKLRHKAFCHSLKLGKDMPNLQVERALYHRAIGYSHPDQDIRVVNGEIVITPIVKHYPPDTKAALAWSYNRMSDRWHPQPDSDKASPDDLAAALMILADKLPS